MLHLNGLGKRFGDQWILRDLNLQVDEGECVALLGASGCGKSTALRLIAGLERQDEGSIELDGVPLDRIPAERRRIAMVFQSYALFPHLSVRENLNLGLKIRGVSPAKRQQRIESVLETVRLRRWPIDIPSSFPAASVNGLPWPELCSVIPGSTCWTNR